MFCNKCGDMLLENAKFCDKCGAPQQVSQSQPPTPSNHISLKAEIYPQTHNKAASLSKNKKILIIVIAIVVLIGIVAGVMFFVPKNVADKSYQGKLYTGEWVKGKPNGEGTLTEYDGGIIYSEKNGNFVDGLLKGTGTALLYNKNRNEERKYEGDFIDGELNSGICTMRDEKGNLAWEYEGDFVDLKPNGKGKQTSFNEKGVMVVKREGDFADGIFVRGTHGKYYVKEGNIGREYAGDFVYGHLNGKGTETYYDKNGDIEREYAGDFVDGELNGKGTSIIHPENMNWRWKFEGDFVDGELVKGIMTKYDLDGNILWVN